MLLSSTLLLWGIRWGSFYRLGVGLASLATMLLLVNLFPDNPYFALTLREWNQGRLLHFNEVMQWISYIWLPFAILWALRSQFATLFAKRPI
jgi:hypothetical protein